MQHKFLNTSLTIREQNISYYDSIATQYNNMVGENSDKTVRQKVANKFSATVKSATVLDFGGGTGLDLGWLTNNNHKIIFCEPSSEMRKIAIEASKELLNQNIVFLNDFATDFRQWRRQPPTFEKVDAVLANFAVVNCIPDIELLFQNFSTVIKPGKNIIALVLTKNLKKILRNHFRSILRSVIFNKPLSIKIEYKNYQQTVYIYSMKEIIKASKDNFTLSSSEKIAGSGFTLIHLIRK